MVYFYCNDLLMCPYVALTKDQFIDKLKAIQFNKIASF